MRISIHDTTQNRNVTIDVKPDVTFGKVLDKVRTHLNLNKGDYWIMKGDKQLLPEQTLAKAGIVEGDTLNLVPSLRGGNNFGISAISSRTPV